ncbi:MAG: hypothetical protein ACM3MM_04275, partial [Acidobacteriota bacterium]
MRVTSCIVVVGMVVAGCADSSAQPPESSSTLAVASTSGTTNVPVNATVTSSPAVTTALPALEAVESLGAVEIVSRPFPDWVSLSADTAWVANAEEGVARYDATTGSLVGSVPTGVAVCAAMDVAFDSLWVPDCDGEALVRVDLASGLITATIDVGAIAEESSVASTTDGVFVLIDAGATIVRIDPLTDTVAASVAAPVGATAMRGAGDQLWVTSAQRGVLSSVDPVDGTVRNDVAVGRGASFLAVGEGSAWTLDSGDGTVTRVDLATGTVVATIDVATVPIQGGDMAFGGGSAWARVSDALVVEIDPTTNTAVRRIGVPEGSGSVAAADDAVWITAHDVVRVYRVPLG